MLKSFIFYFYVSTICFGFSDLANLECSFFSQGWHVLGNLYSCQVTKGITINSLDSAYVNSSTGSHLSGQTNDNVNFLSAAYVTISYFPRGLNSIFKNLKGIYFSSVGLKEIHQSDLKPFPMLVELLVYQNSNLEILEEGLFDFNPELEYIALQGNKITHIDPKVFDSLTKLKQLHLTSNTCINKGASDRTSVQNFITELKSKCNNSEYSSIDQKLKFLELESKSLNFNYFKVELEKLESKVNASKYVNFYQTKLQNLKTILHEKSQDAQNCETFNINFLNLVTNLESLINQFSKKIENISQGSSNEAVSQQCMSLNDSFLNLNKKVENIDIKIINLNENISNVSQTVSIIQTQMSSLKESFLTFNKEASTEAKDNFAKNNENYAELNEEITNIKKSVESIDKKLEEFKGSIITDRKVESTSIATHDVIAEVINKAVEKIEKNLMEKIDDNLKEMTFKVQESEKRFNERTTKVLKALKVIFDVSDMALNYSLQ